MKIIAEKLLPLIFVIQVSGIAASVILSVMVVDDNDEIALATSEEEVGVQSSTPLHQLNCTVNPSICNTVCGENKKLPYSSTFCDSSSGSCVCDCRDVPRKDCVETPFTPCFQNCVRMNPNPDVFLYKGGNCPMSKENGTVSYQCACRCTFRDDYEETNDIF